jgi:hypothetical protein
MNTTFSSFERKCRTMHCVAISLAMAMPVAIRAHAQCYIDPATGQRVCTRPPGTTPGGRAPAFNSQLVNLDSSAHCRISIDDGTLGSGTLVDRDAATGLVLTCAHLFDDSSGQIVVTLPQAGRFAARILEIDRTNDLAAVAIRRPEADPLQVADGEPVGMLTACGYGPAGVFRAIRGSITGRATIVGADVPSTTIAGAVRPGDSGGAILNAQGQLAGVIWGQRDGQTYATCGRTVFEFLNRIRSKRLCAPTVATTPSSGQPPALPGVPSPDFDWKAWTTELDARLRALDAKKQDRGEYLQHGDLNGYLRTDDATKLNTAFATRAEVDGKVGVLTSRFETVSSAIASVREHLEHALIDRGGLAQGMSAGKLAVGALGLSGPLAVAVVIAGGLVGRRVKSRLTRIESHLTLPTLNTKPSTHNPTSIAIDSPPLPQRSVPETHYVPVEKDSFAKAHQWASEHVARKYPGATEVLQTQDSLIKQFIAGK